MSIEALNWARKIHVGDAYGKSVLRAIADYADESGNCFPSLSRLADDCDLSIDSVRRRVKLLEDAGIIVTFRCWVDEHGRRNQDQRGRETSRDIRLPLGLVRTRDTTAAPVADHDEGEGTGEAPLANSKGGPPSQQLGADSHSSQGPPSSRATPPLAVGPPLEPSLNDQSNKNPPSPPSGGGADSDADEEGEDQDDDDFAEFMQAWAQPILRVSKARSVWRALNVGERQLACKAARGYFAHRKSEKRPPGVINPHTFLQEPEAWQGFAALAPVDRAIVPLHFVAEGSIEWRALNVIRLISGHALLQAHRSEEGRGERSRGELTAAQLALARFADDDPATWQVVKAGTQQCGAWRAFLGVEPRLIVVGYTTSPLDSSRKDWPVKQEGLRVPWPWPPRKDGTFADDDGRGSGEGCAA